MAEQKYKFQIDPENIKEGGGIFEPVPRPLMYFRKRLDSFEKRLYISFNKYRQLYAADEIILKLSVIAFYFIDIAKNIMDLHLSDEIVENIIEEFIYIIDKYIVWLLRMVESHNYKAGFFKKLKSKREINKDKKYNINKIKMFQFRLESIIKNNTNMKSEMKSMFISIKEEVDTAVIIIDNSKRKKPIEELEYQNDVLSKLGEKYNMNEN